MKDLTAVILAGGKGSRMVPWPAPKCLMPVNGIPIIDRLLTHLKASVNRVIVCVGCRALDVESALRENRWDFDYFHFSNAGEDASMCERLLKARKDFDIKGRILVCYGDELADVDIAALLAQHAACRDHWTCLMTLTTHRARLPFGVVDCGTVRDDVMVEINIGFAVIETEALDLVLPTMSLPDIFNMLRSGQNGYMCETFLHKGKRATVNNFQELENAEKVWK